MRTRTTTHWLVLGAGAVLLALVVGVPLGAGAVAPAASPTASPFRTATPFPTVNPRVIATVWGTTVAELTRTAGTPFPRPAPGSVETAAAGYIPTAQARAAATFTAQAGTATARAGGSPAGSPTPDPCLTPVPASAEWTTYTTKDGKVSFEYPANWLVGETESDSVGRLLVEIYNAPGTCTHLIGLLGLKAVPPRVWIKLSRTPNGLDPHATIDEWRDKHPATVPGGPEVVADGATRVSAHKAYRSIVRPLGKADSIFASYWFAVEKTLYAIEAYSITDDEIRTLDQLAGTVVIR